MQKGKIFISYRQSDTQSEASRLKENLEEVFGESNVFFDIETLEPGLNFALAIEKTIKQSKVVLVLIGPTWTEVKDENGNLRLFNDNDWVRREVAMALCLNESGTIVIPVLVKNARQLSKDQLPEDIQALADVQWAELSIKRWKADVESLITVLKKITQKSGAENSNDKFDANDLFKHPKDFGNIFKSSKEPKDFSSLQGIWKAYKYYIIAFIIFVIAINSCAEEEYPIDDYGYGYVIDSPYHHLITELPEFYGKE